MIELSKIRIYGATVSDDVGPTKSVAIVKTTKSNYEKPMVVVGMYKFHAQLNLNLF